MMKRTDFGPEKPDSRECVAAKKEGQGLRTRQRGEDAEVDQFP